ncbi:hypothetical protein N9X52_04000, partial [Candidatus Poseidonia alphae]|nr:hypothetical protein [Candidatus Poseidonia alphae]
MSVSTQPGWRIRSEEPIAASSFFIDIANMLRAVFDALYAYDLPLLQSSMEAIRLDTITTVLDPLFSSKG